MNRNLLKCLVVVIVFPVTLGLKEDFQMPKYSNALTRAVVDIIEQFFFERTNTLNFYHASIENEDKNLERNVDAMNEILYQIKSKAVVQLEGYTDFKPSSRKRMHNIIFIDSYESFWSFFRIMSPYYFEYQGYYLIVLTTYSDQQYTIMKEIFDWVWADYIINLNIIWLAPQNDEEAIMYTYFPYTSFYCGKAIPIQLNQHRFGKWLNAPVVYYPQKIYDLHGCPLTVATVSSPPFMILQKQSDGEIYTDGIDGILLRVLSQRMNFKLNIVWLDDQGTVNMKGQSSGAIQMVLQNKANLSIGYISTTATRNMFMTSSYIYHTSNLVWLTSPGRKFTSIEKLFKPFVEITWSCVLLVFALSYIAIRVVKLQKKIVQSFVFGRHNSSPCLNTINIFFGGSLHKLPIRNFARTLLAFFMIYCLVIRSSYTGALFNFMRSESRVPDPKNFHEMYEKNYTFYVLESSQEFVANIPEIVEKSVLIQRQNLSVVQERLLDSSAEGALLSSEEHTAFLNKKVFPHKFFHYAEELFIGFNLCIYMHRQSCLEEDINQHIIMLKSNGLLDSWVKHFVDRSYLKERILNGPKVMVLEQLAGAYELLAVGLLLSVMVFLFEMLSLRFASLQNIF